MEFELVEWHCSVERPVLLWLSISLIIVRQILGFSENTIHVDLIYIVGTVSIK
jgi:hypothetical protein